MRQGFLTLVNSSNDIPTRIGSLPLPNTTTPAGGVTPALFSACMENQV